MRRQVLSCEEEWRTEPRGFARRSNGRAMLWIGLSCGHYEQRLVRVAPDGSVRAPKHAKCSECELDRQRRLAK